MFTIINQYWMLMATTGSFIIRTLMVKLMLILIIIIL